LFLRFLNAKPNTLQGILNTEKDKTDRQGCEFGIKDLTVESLNTYNECFKIYKDQIELSISDTLDEIYKSFNSFNGFIMTTKGDLIYGSLEPYMTLKKIIVSRAKIMKETYRQELSVIFIKRT